MRNILYTNLWLYRIKMCRSRAMTRVHRREPRVRRLERRQQVHLFTTGRGSSHLSMAAATDPSVSGLTALAAVSLLAAAGVLIHGHSKKRIEAADLIGFVSLVGAIIVAALSGTITYLIDRVGLRGCRGNSLRWIWWICPEPRFVDAAS